MRDGLKVTLNTLTPLWTGGVRGVVDRIHETGIIGSLRWWFEILVRGVGGTACYPTTASCLYDPDKPSNGLCDVCQVFGATGWRRRFRLHIVEEDVCDAQIAPTISLRDRQYTDEQGNIRTPTWYFQDPTRSNIAPNTPKKGPFRIIVQSLDPRFQPEIIAGLIQFIADWAAIGARAQMGFGVVELANHRIDTRPLFEWLKQNTGTNVYSDLPSLQNIFLARIAPKDGRQFSEEDTFNLKYDLRQVFSGTQNKNLRHFIMGTVRGQRIAAKVKISRPYNHGRAMRVWGWIPEKTDVYQNSWDRDSVLDAIYQHLDSAYKLKVWREMNSIRDTVTPKNSDAVAFLQSLLGIEEVSDAA